MIYSEILQEKNRIQAKLSVEGGSAHEYLIRSRLATEEIARSYGFSFKYAELSENNIEKIGGILIGTVQHKA